MEFSLVKLLCFAGTLFSLANAQSCKTDLAEEGAKLCQEAFHDTYEEHKLRLISDSKTTGCCLTYGMTECIEYAFTEAQCSPEEQEVAQQISDKVKEAQDKLGSLLKHVGKTFCSDHDSSKCIHMDKEFTEAKQEIETINGVGTSRPSLLAFLLSLLGIALTASFC